MKYWVYLFLFFICPAFAWPYSTLFDGAIPVESASNAKHFEWRASLGGEFMNDAFSDAKIVSLEANLRGYYPFSSMLTANFAAGVYLQNGSTQSLNTDEFRPLQNIYLEEARINWQSLPFFTLFAGALNQNHHGSPIFISNKTFPAVMEYFHFPLGSWQLSFNAQQAVPTAQSFSTRAVGKESSPYLFTENARLEYKDPANFSAAARATYFRFRNLTHGIAQDGRFYGNTVLGFGPKGALFLYPYEGVEAGLDLRAYLHRHWGLFAGNSFLNNSKAPHTKNRATYEFVGLGFFDDKIEVAPKFGIFRIEGDAAPAFYTYKTFGHNNRRGWMGAVTVRLVPERVRLEGVYVKADILDATPTQFDRSYFKINLSTDFYSL